MRAKTLACVSCGRRFAEHAAIPVPLVTCQIMGRFTVTGRHWKPGCPRCYTYDEIEEGAVRLDATGNLAPSLATTEGL
jgi:hypothetical protein